MGSGDTASQVHYDADHNVHCLLAGKVTCYFTCYLSHVLKSRVISSFRSIFFVFVLSQNKVYALQFYDNTHISSMLTFSGKKSFFMINPDQYHKMHMERLEHTGSNYCPNINQVGIIPDILHLSVHDVFIRLCILDIRGTPPFLALI